MGTMSNRWAKLGKYLATSCAAITLGMSSVVMAAAAPDEPVDKSSLMSPEQIEANRIYLQNIVPVYYPPVPYGWECKIEEGAVKYIRNERNSKRSETVITLRYTRKTSQQDASSYMDYYIASHACDRKVKQGTGFYSTACLTNNTYAIVIGEPDNMYIIELTGEYNTAARAIIENYVGSIVHGKKVFFDRNVGDLKDRD